MVFGIFRKKTKPAPPKKALKKAVKPDKPKEELIGRVVHYFPKVKAAVIRIDKGPLLEGESIHIKGYTTDIKQKISSMQIDRVPVKRAAKGKEAGIRVKKRVRITDKVYKDKA